MKNHAFRLCILVVSISLIFPELASAQQAVGIVTALKGNVQLTRATTQTALSFKDDLILRDVINTLEKSMTRVLFGGKSTVTVRELSSFEVREELLPGGGSRTNHELSSGSILVNVARSLLRRGDEVQIHTPNAVAAVRGSAVFAQYNPELAQSTFAVLTGSAVVTPQGLAPITLTPLTSVSVTGTAATGVQSYETTITQGEANVIAAGSEVGLESSDTGESADAGVQEAVQLMETVVAAVEATVVDTAESAPAPQGTDESATTAPVTAGGGGENITEETASPSFTASDLPFIFATDTISNQNPLFDVTDATVNVGGDVITVNSGVNVSMTGPLLAVDPSTITAGGNIITVNSGGSLSAGGSLFADIGGTINAGLNLLKINSGSVTSAGTSIQFSNSTVSIGTDLVGLNGGSLSTSGSLLNLSGGTLGAGSLLNLTGGASLTAGGSLLDISGANLSVTGAVADVSGLSTLTNTAGPVIKANNSTITADSLLKTDGGGNNFNFTGTMMDLTNSTVTVRVIEDEPVSPDLDNFSITLGANEPMFRLNNSTLDMTGTALADSLVILDGSDFAGSTLAGLGLIATNNSTITNNGGGLVVMEGTLNSTSTQALVQITGSNVTTKLDPMFEVEVFGGGPTNITMAGPFANIGGTVNSELDLFQIRDGATLTSTTTSPFLAFNNSTVNVTSGDLFDISGGAGGGTSLSTGGSLLDLDGTSLNVTGALVNITSTSTLTNNAGPVIKANNSTITADSLVSSDESGNNFNFTGTILDLTDTTVTFRIISDDPPMSPGNDNLNVIVAANEPLLRLNNSTLTITGTTNDETLLGLDGADFSGGIFPGVVLIAANNSTVTNQGGGILEMEGVLTTTSTNPLVQITNSTVNVSSSTPSELFIVEDPGSGGSTNITMSGPLASIASTVTTDQDFFLMDTGAKLTSNTTSPFIKATDATLTVGSGGTEFYFFEVESSGTPAPSGAQFTTTSSAPLVEFSNTTLNQGGTNLVLFKATGTGTGFQPIKGTQPSFTVNSQTASNPIGALFKATNASDITVDTALKLDNALFEATLPIVDLVGSLTTQTQITSDGTFADIGSANASKLVLKGPVFSLNKGLITVTNGPLLSLKNGSTMDVLGDFLKLINGSTINVVNGPAILVENPGSVLSVTGALLDFGNTSGNSLIINNAISPTVTISGIPVSEGTTSSISIGSNPIINNPGGNTITISGSVIATGIGGGTVNITAP